MTTSKSTRLQGNEKKAGEVQQGWRPVLKPAQILGFGSMATVRRLMQLILPLSV